MRTVWTILLWTMCLAGWGQQLPAVEVAQLTQRVGPNGEETLYYSFAEGDRIILTVEEEEGRKLKSIELIAYPDRIIFSHLETPGFVGQPIQILQTGVYSLRLTNNVLIGERKCRVQIRRIPGQERYAMFNTGVRWVEKVDTVYKSGGKEISGYQSQTIEQERKVLVKADTQAVTLLERTERIYARTGVFYGDNATQLQFTLPNNRYIPSTSDPDQTSEVISWVYWLGVGDDADRSYQQANAKALSKLVDAALDLRILAGGGYGALAILAIKGYSLFSNPPKGDNVQYQLLRIQPDGKHEVLDKGSSIMAYRRVDNPLQGTYAFKLTNDNYVDGINVTVKVLAVTLNKTYKRERYTETHQQRIENEDLLGKPVIRVNRVPMLMEQQH